VPELGIRWRGGGQLPMSDALSDYVAAAVDEESEEGRAEDWWETVEGEVRWHVVRWDRVVGSLLDWIAEMMLVPA